MTDRQLVQAPCHVCRRTQRQYLVATINRVEVDELIDEIFDYDLLECGGCGHGNFRVRSDYAGGGNDGIENYPRFSPKERPAWFWKLDDPMRSILVEVYNALANYAEALAVLGLRTLLDRVIQDKVGDRGSFEAGLGALQDGGYITAGQRESLKIAVDAGHAAAHRGHRFKDEQIHNLLRISEHLLEQFYVIKADAAGLRAATPPRSRPRKK